MVFISLALVCAARPIPPLASIEKQKIVGRLAVVKPGGSWAYDLRKGQRKPLYKIAAQQLVGVRSGKFSGYYEITLRHDSAPYPPDFPDSLVPLVEYIPANRVTTLPYNVVIPPKKGNLLGEADAVDRRKVFHGSTTLSRLAGTWQLTEGWGWAIATNHKSGDGPIASGTLKIDKDGLIQIEVNGKVGLTGYATLAGDRLLLRTTLDPGSSNDVASEVFLLLYQDGKEVWIQAPLSERSLWFKK